MARARLALHAHASWYACTYPIAFARVPSHVCTSCDARPRLESRGPGRGSVAEMPALSRVRPPGPFAARGGSGRISRSRPHLRPPPRGACGDRPAAPRRADRARPTPLARAGPSRPRPRAKRGRATPGRLDPPARPRRMPAGAGRHGRAPWGADAARLDGAAPALARFGRCGHSGPWGSPGRFAAVRRRPGRRGRPDAPKRSREGRPPRDAVRTAASPDRGDGRIVGGISRPKTAERRMRGRPRGPVTLGPGFIPPSFGRRGHRGRCTGGGGGPTRWAVPGRGRIRAGAGAVVRVDGGEAPRPDGRGRRSMPPVRPAPGRDVAVSAGSGIAAPQRAAKLPRAAGA